MSLHIQTQAINIYLLLSMSGRISLMLGIIFLILVPMTKGCLSTQFTANGVCYSCSLTCLTCTSSTTTSCLTCESTTRNTLNSQNACQCKDGYVERSTVAATCVALTCSYTCLTCNNTVTACTSCSTANNRIYVSSSLTCPCIAKYYDSGSASCTACHYTCGQCNGATSSTCTYCDTTAFRTLTTTSCPCNAGYYDNSVYTCAACNHECATCTASTSCLTCGANRGAAPTCYCSQGFYDDGISTPCITCHISCQNCSNGTSCNICSASNFRILTSLSPLCSCMNRYYDVGVAACSPCDPRCFTCISLTVCLTCNAIAFRTYISASKFCQCMTGYYQTSTTLQLCSKCDSRCLTCSGSSTNCLTCDSTMNRAISGTTCPCKTGFYQNTYTTCSACDSSCYTCVNGYSCSSCVASTLQTVNSSGLCSCTSTMFYNTTVSICQTCSYRCATCRSTNASSCLTCPANSFRTFSNSTCPCNTYYYDDGSSSTCKACDHSCNTCSSNTNTACLRCNTAAYRYYSNGYCLCKTYYYDNGALELCQPCMYNCLTCIDATSCSACDATLFRTLSTAVSPVTCACSLYYFQNSNKTCVSCLYHCYSCNSLTNCLTCDAIAFRIFNITTQLCDCMPGYYDNFVDQICLPCLPECYTCTNATTCTSCSASLYRVLSSTNRCPCKDLYFDVSGTCTGCLYYCSTCSGPSTCATCNGTAYRVLNTASQCICSPNYYDDGSHQLCATCSYACLTCVTTSNKCVTCDTTLRLFQSNWCACPQYFYDNNVTVACVACHYTCDTCLIGSKCATCSASKFRIFDSVNKYCICMVGYYDDGTNQLCLACNLRCLTCTNSSVCLTCSPTSFRSTPSAVCPCLDGYYDSNTPNCPACQYTCNTCSNGNQCLTCEATTNHRTFNSNFTCSCIDRFYDDGKNNQLCLACVYTCVTCSGSATTCTSCNATAFRTLSNGDCNCLQHFYDNLVELCLPCHYTCLTCTNPTRCTSCDASGARIINATTGLCSCMNMYWDDGSSQQCNKCNPTCLTCLNTLSCVTCSTARNRILNSTTDIYNVSSPFCVCLYRYYSVSASQDCQPCHYSCQVCSAGTRQSCVICNAAALRYFNAATTSCLCNNGTYDTNITQQCLTCNPACTLCTTGLPNSCTACSPLYYLLIATTTCYTICPNFYFNYQKNFTCQSCSPSCQVCLNQTYCSQCASGSYLYNRSCLSTCPVGTYTVPAQGLCNDCPTGCKACTGTTYCSSCFNKYYYNLALGYCFTCNSVCLTCSGPGQDQCITCESPLHLIGSTCTVLSCPAGTYVDPVSGCQRCSSLFQGSLNCNITNSFSCQQNYKLINSSCVFCNSVPGYRMSSGICGQICGDGILIYLQCDDGNNANGDGCSSNCLIQQGWNCTANATGPSVCVLKDDVTIDVLKYSKKAGVNQVSLYLQLSIPIILSSSKLILSIANLASNDYSYKIMQNKQTLTEVQVVIYYNADIQNKKLSIAYSQSRRLQENADNRKISYIHTARMLASIAFNGTFNINTYPPAVYYPPSTSAEFANLQYDITAITIGLLVLCFILVPKKMHLHVLSVVYLPAHIFIACGLVSDKYTDWIKYSLDNMTYSALIGGFSFGSCCTDQSTYYNITTQLMTMSAIVLFVLLASWLLYGFMQYIHNSCMNIEKTRKNISYFILTLTLSVLFTIMYSSINTLYHFTLLTPTDTFNSVLGVLLSIFFFLLVISLWIITYQTTPPISKNDRTVHVDKQVLFDIQSDNEKITENPSSKRKITSEEIISDMNSEQSKATRVDERVEKQASSILHYDYISLYNHARRVMMNRQSTIAFSKAKYFLPLLISKIYLNAVLSSLMQAQPFNFFIVSTLLQVIFVLFMLIVKPFTSKFTNFRIILVSLAIIATNVSIQIYIYHSRNSQYFIFYERLTVYLIIATLASATFFILLQHILSWRSQMWRLIQPCLKGSRLMGHRVNKIDLEQSSDSMRKSSFKMSRSSFRGEVYRNQREEIDAFYARMLKKQQLNKEYRRERMLK